MVQKQQTPPARRGRPRLYDPDVALDRAIDVFWDRGYSATSLDDLCAAMDMNRPSLYAAFGDKRELFMTALARYRDRAQARFRLAFEETAGADAVDARQSRRGRPLVVALKDYFSAIVTRAFSGEKGPRGCFMMSVAAVEAAQDPKVRALVVESMARLEKGLEARFRRAIEDGELSPSADPLALAHLAVGLVHTLSVRARAGDKRETLDGVIDAFLSTMTRQGGSGSRSSKRRASRP